MPSRSTSQEEPGPYWVQLDWSGSWLGEDYVPPLPKPDSIRMGPFYSPGVLDTYEEYDGPNPTRGNSWTNFTHYKASYGTLPSGKIKLPRVQGVWPNSYGACWIGSFPPYVGWLAHNWTAPLEVLPKMHTTDGAGGLSCITPPDIGAIVSSLLKGMMPGIKTELSLINSIIELKDFKSFIKDCKSLVKSAIASVKRFRDLTAHLPRDFWGGQVIGDLRRGWVKYLKGLKKAGKTELARRAVVVASENYLQWKFAWAPLISDVRAVRRALSTLERKINNLVTNEGRVRTSHGSASRILGSSPTTEVTTSLQGPAGFLDYGPYWDAPSTQTIRVNESSVSARIHVELRYNYNLTQYQRENARILALQDALGVQYNPAIIWNAVRFTFLIDWVLSVGSYLDQFKVAHMEPKVNVLGALWSCQAERHVTWSKTMYHGGMPGGLGTPLPSKKEVSYVRRTFMPSRSSLTGSGLSSSELTLGAALVFATRGRKAGK